MAVLTRDQVLEVQDRTIEEVDVPAWGGSVCFGSLKLRDLAAFGERFAGIDTNQGMAASVDLHVELLIAVCCDISGDMMFTEDDTEWLGDRDGATIIGLAQKALAFLGLTQDSHDEEVKNSESTPTEPTGSSSPES